MCDRYVGQYAFYLCTDLQSIVIPSSVAYLGDGAFTSCWSLTMIVIPDSVLSIAAQTFKGCNSLYGVTIPNSVTEIGSQAFLGCTNLSGIIIPDSVLSIGSYAFFQCVNLANVLVSNFATVIDSFAFAHCSCESCLYTRGAALVDCKPTPTSMPSTSTECPPNQSHHETASGNAIVVYSIMGMTLLAVVAMYGWVAYRFNYCKYKSRAAAQRVYAVVNDPTDDEGECWPEDDATIGQGDSLDVMQGAGDMPRLISAQVSFPHQAMSGDHSTNAAYISTFFRSLGMKRVSAGATRGTYVELVANVDEVEDEQLITV